MAAVFVAFFHEGEAAQKAICTCFSRRELEKERESKAD